MRGIAEETHREVLFQEESRVYELTPPILIESDFRFDREEEDEYGFPIPPKVNVSHVRIIRRYPLSRIVSTPTISVYRCTAEGETFGESCLIRREYGAFADFERILLLMGYDEEQSELVA